MTAALCVVIMLLGAVLGLGIYISPMLAGIGLIPVGNTYGKKYHTMLWIAVSILCFMLVPNVEENLMFLCLFGCYPLIRPFFQKLPGVISLIVKLLFFTVVFATLELMIVRVLVPEPVGNGLLILLVLLGVITLMLYDFILPLAEVVLSKRIGKLINR